MVYFLLITLIILIPQLLVQSTYNKYSRMEIKNGKTGEMLVYEMLRQNGVNDVDVERIGGMLSDHYDSRAKKIRLSSDNFNNPSVASIAIAAHETGHALQDNKGYFFLKLRHTLGPVTMTASKASWIFLLLGIILYFSPFFWFGIILFSVVVVFDLVTLPVEINASNRAKQYLASTGAYSEEELYGASKVLNAAALTYVAATLASILQLIRLISRVRRD